jgi:hypothetical protein
MKLLFGRFRSIIAKGEKANAQYSSLDSTNMILNNPWARK